MTFRGRPPFGWESVTVERDGQERPLGMTAVRPGHEARHSPTGFSWSYGGSGPAELSRAILVEVYKGTPEERIVRQSAAYMRFKWDVIAALPAEGFTLTADEVRGWYVAWLRTAAGQAVADALRFEDLREAAIAQAEATDSPRPLRELKRYLDHLVEDHHMTDVAGVVDCVVCDGFRQALA